MTAESDNMMRQRPKLWTSLLFIFLAIHPGLCRNETDPDVSFTSTPTAISEGQTKSLRLRCSPKTSTPNATGVNSTEGYSVHSIVVSRNISKTRKEDVATISLQHPAQKKSNDESLEVSGHLSLANQTEPAFLQMTWADPKREQSGFYTCTVHGFNKKGRKVVLKSSLFEKYVGPDIQDVMLQVSQMKKDLDASLERIRNLELKVNQLNNSRLKPHIETGEIVCGPFRYYNIVRVVEGEIKFEMLKFANFTTPYLSKPVVISSFNVLHSSKLYNTRVYVKLNDVSLNGFSIVCGTWNLSIVYDLGVTWTSFGFE